MFTAGSDGARRLRRFNVRNISGLGVFERLGLSTSEAA
jgi:hypothetical protein